MQKFLELSARCFARGIKGHLFIYFGIVVFIGLVLYNFQIFRVVQELQEKTVACHQRQEKLSSKLQVIIDYSLTLEKFLKKAKADHQQMKEELQKSVYQEKQFRVKNNLISVKKYTSLQQQYILLQSQYEDLTDKCNKLEVTHLKGLAVKNKLVPALQTVKQNLEQLYVAKEKEMQSLKSHFERLESKNDRLVKQNKELVTHTQDLASRANHLEENNIQLKNEITELKNSLKRCRINLNRRAELETLKAAESPATKEKSKVQSIPSPSSSLAAVILEEVNIQEPSKKEAGGKVRSSSPNPVASNKSVTDSLDVNLEQIQSNIDQMLNKSLRNNHLQKTI